MSRDKRFLFHLSGGLLFLAVIFVVISVRRVPSLASDFLVQYQGLQVGSTTISQANQQLGKRAEILVPASDCKPTACSVNFAISNSFLRVLHLAPATALSGT